MNYFYFEGLFSASYVVNGSSQCGYAFNALDGHVYLFFYLHLSLEILWYVQQITENKEMENLFLDFKFILGSFTSLI